MSKISLDVESIVKKTINSTFGNTREPKRDGLVTEAHVAEPKKFKQISDNSSQKTKDSHYDLYKGYVESFNKISAALDSADRDSANVRHSKFRSLKVDEAYNTNAVYLHELYFANCFDPNSEIYMDSMPYIRIQRDFGTFEEWQKDFVACGLSANEGWVVCSYNMFLKRFVNSVIDSHSQNVLLGSYPVIVVDMWSHSYYKDYLSDKKNYLLNQMKEFNWNVISERFEKVEKLIEALR